MARYQYSPLNQAENEIRAVSLLAGSSDDEIRINIQIIRLEDNATHPVPEFEALSYTWGSASDKADITVFDHTSKQVYSLAVTENLARALPYLRYPDKERILWIDAICINQEDLEERSNQVLRMSTIYSLARQVIVWLGQEENDSDHALTLLQSLGSQIEVNWRDRTMKALVPADNDLVDSKTALPYSEKDYIAIEALTARSWFERLWIRQEIQRATSASVVCGDKSILWSHLRNAMFYLYSRSEVEMSKELKDRIDLIEELSDYGEYMPLGLLLIQTRFAKCSDPKDRVFALLGLVHENDRKKWDFKPDYRKSIAQVYEDVSFSYMETFGDLELLRNCDIGNRNTPGLPYWVPDWNCMQNFAAPILAAMADHTSPGDYKRSKRGECEVLHAKGIHVDKIEEIHELGELDHSPSHAQALMFLRDISRKVMHDRGPEYLGGSMLKHAICRTFRMGVFQTHWDPPVTSILTEDQGRDFIDLLLTDHEIESLAENEMARKYLIHALRYLRGRSLIVTEKGYIGLALRASRPGDHINVLLGCVSPLVLRCTTPTHATTEYQVVGECYIDGLMCGEAILGPFPPHWENLFAFNEELNGHHPAYRDLQTQERHWVDPRWDVVLGSDYAERLGTKSMTLRDEKEAMICEALKIRGVKAEWFDLV